VHEGSVLNVATLAAEPGSRVELNEVLLVTDGDKITVGVPTVADAVVVAEVMAHGKARKVTNFKFKAKVRYRRKRGHRQPFTRLAVREIRIGGATTGRGRSRNEAEAPTAPAETPAAETPAEEPAATATPRRRRRTTESSEQE
jgi:large subunit ribosomal protein L21